MRCASIDCRSHVGPNPAEDAAVLQVLHEGLLEIVDCPIPSFQLFFRGLPCQRNAGREYANLAVNSDVS